MKFKDIKISMQINMVFGFILLLAIIIESFSLYNAERLWQNTQELYNHPLTVQQTLAKIQTDVSQMQLEMNNLLLNENKQEIQEKMTAIDTYENDILTQLDILYSAYLGPSSNIDNIYNSLIDYKTIRNDIIRIYQQGNTAEALKMDGFDGVGGLKAQEVMNDIALVKDFARNKAEQFYNDAIRHKNINTTLLVIIFITILIFLITAAILFKRGGLRPLKELTEVTDAFRHGDMDARSDYAAHNEIGKLSVTFNRMADTVQKEIQDKEKFANELLDFQNNLEILVDQKTEELVNTNMSLLKSEERYKALTQTSMDGFFAMDIDGNILEVNDSYSLISGYPKEKLLTMNIVDLGYYSSKKHAAAHIKRIIDRDWDQFDSGHRRADGTTYYVHNNMTYIPNEEIIICFVNDITEKRKSEEEVIYLSYHDQLTGLYNYRYYNEELEKLDTEMNLPLTLIMGDVNGLKTINDTFGHAEGNELLKKAADAMRNSCRGNDPIARIGGDEFILILPRTDSADAIRIIDRIRDLASSEKAGTKKISISFGYATKTSMDENIHSIFNLAESHMYRNKLSEKSNEKSNEKTVEKNSGESC